MIITQTCTVTKRRHTQVAMQHQQKQVAEIAPVKQQVQVSHMDFGLCLSITNHNGDLIAATVTFNDQTFTVEGYEVIEVPAHGWYQLLIEAAGYSTYSQQVYINRKLTHNATMELSAEWGDKMIASRFALNPHFTDEHKAWEEPILREILAPDHVLYDTNGEPLDWNYYGVYGPNGQNRQTADFFAMYQKSERRNAGRIIDNVLFDYNGTVYGESQNEHYDEGYMFLTGQYGGEHSGNFGGIWWNLGSAGFKGNVQRLDYLNFPGGKPRFVFYRRNEFTGIAPNDDVLESGSYPNYDSYENNFTGATPVINWEQYIESYRVYGNQHTSYQRNRWTGGRRMYLQINGNNISSSRDIDNFLNDCLWSFQYESPSENCLIRCNGEGMGLPTKQGYKDIRAIERIFLDAGLVVTIKYNADFRIKNIEAYLNQNEHLTPEQEGWSIDALWDILDENYALVDADGLPVPNWYERMQGNETADWFLLFEKKTLGAYAGQVSDAYLDYNGTLETTAKHNEYGSGYLFIVGNYSFIGNWYPFWFDFRGGGFKGAIPSIENLNYNTPSSLVQVYWMHENHFTTIPNKITLRANAYCYISDNDFKGVPSPIVNEGLSIRNIRFYNCNFGSYQRNNWSILGTREYFDFRENDFDTLDQDAIFEDMYSSFNSVAPSKSSSLYLTSSRNSDTPSAAGLVALEQTENIFEQAGFILISSHNQTT